MVTKFVEPKSEFKPADVDDVLRDLFGDQHLWQIHGEKNVAERQLALRATKDYILRWWESTGKYCEHPKFTNSIVGDHAISYFHGFFESVSGQKLL